MLHPHFIIRVDSRVRIIVNRLGSYAAPDKTSEGRRQSDYLAVCLYTAFVRAFYGLTEGANTKLVPLQLRDVGFQIAVGEHGDCNHAGRPPVWIQLVIDRTEVFARHETADGVATFTKRFGDLITAEGLFGGNFNGRPTVQLDVILVDGHTEILR